MPVPQGNCPACDSTQQSSLPTYCEWNATQWNLVRCASCGHRYTDPMPTDREIEQMYSNEYFGEDGAWVCGFWKGSYVSNEKKLRREAQEALDLLPVKTGRLLEIGAAGGFFLDEARHAGFTVTGIELNEQMAEWGREQLKVDIKCGMFGTMPLADASYDVIVAQDVLEHIREPRDFVAHVRRLLVPGGVSFVRGPLEQSWREAIYLGLRKRLHRPAKVVHQPPYHLHGFVRDSFRRIVEAAGLDVTLFQPSSIRIPGDFSSPKAVASSVIDAGAYLADRVSARGDFMLACATLPAER